MIKRKFFNLKNLRRKPLWIFSPFLIPLVVAACLFVFTPKVEIQKAFTQKSSIELIEFIIYFISAAVILIIVFSFFSEETKR